MIFARRGSSLGAPRVVRSSTPQRFYHIGTIFTPLPKQNDLDKEFSETDTHQELEDLIINTSKYEFNSFNLATAFSRLGKLRKSAHPAVTQRLLDIARDMYNPDLEESLFTPQELDMMITGTSLGKLFPEVPSFLVKDLKQVRFEDFKDQSVVNVIHSFAQLDAKGVHADMLDALLLTLSRRGALQFPLEELSVLLQSLGTWIHAARRTAQAMPVKFSAKGVRLPSTPPSFEARVEPVLSALSQAFLHRSFRANEVQVISALAGLLSVNMATPEIVDRLCAMTTMRPFESPENLARFLGLVLHSPFASSAAVKTLLEKRILIDALDFHAKFQPKDLMTVVDAFASRSDEASQYLVAVLVKEISRRNLHEFVGPHPMVAAESYTVPQSVVAMQEEKKDLVDLLCALDNVEVRKYVEFKHGNEKAMKEKYRNIGNDRTESFRKFANRETMDFEAVRLAPSDWEEVSKKYQSKASLLERVKQAGLY